MAEPIKVINEEQSSTIDNYLKSYAFCYRLLSLKNYEKKYFETLLWEPESPLKFPVANAKMYEVRHFVMDLPNGDGKLFLFYHYIRMRTVEQCAELLGISRSSAFRLKKRALADAYYHALKVENEMKAF